MAILAGFLAIFTVGGFMALNGSLNVGAYSVLVFLTQRLLWPLTGIALVIDLFERAMASVHRILNLISEPITVIDSAPPGSNNPDRGEVRFKAVSFHYPNSQAGLDDVSFSMQAGETLALVGATGSGKSTVVKLLLRFYDATQGQITIDDKPLSEFSLKSLRQAISLVSQDVYLFDGTIRENILYGRPDASEDEVIEAAKTAEIWSVIEKLTHGLDSPVGERGVLLSGGQRQRLALARAILKNSLILVLDEATSAVDNETEAAIQRSLETIGHDRTVIVIAHRLSTVVAADKIVVLETGRVVEQGSHTELLNKNGAYARQWEVQTGQPVPARLISVT